MGDDIGLGLWSMTACFDFRSTNVVQLSNRNLKFYRFRCHHPLLTQLDLGYISKDIGSIPQGEVLNETLELLINDEIDNDSGTPKKGKGKATFEFQILPLKEGKVSIKKLYILS